MTLSLTPRSIATRLIALSCLHMHAHLRIPVAKGIGRHIGRAPTGQRVSARLRESRYQIWPGIKYAELHDKVLFTTQFSWRTHYIRAGLLSALRLTVRIRQRDVQRGV